MDRWNETRIAQAILGLFSRPHFKRPCARWGQERVGSKKNCQETNQQSGPEFSQPKRYNKHKLTDGLQQTITTNDKKEEKEPIRAVMFVPQTPNSELARELRKNEEELARITGTKLKIVERSGTKLVDILTKSNPWQGEDCERQNCLLCYTKNKTEKNMSQDCVKRNIVYETRCLSCEDKALENIEALEIDEEERTRKRKEIRQYKYIGESSRSPFERGWEHCNDMAQLNKSPMLKHAIANRRPADPNAVDRHRHSRPSRGELRDRARASGEGTRPRSRSRNRSRSRPRHRSHSRSRH